MGKEFGRERNLRRVRMDFTTLTLGLGGTARLMVMELIPGVMEIDLKDSGKLA